jgi:phenylacetate-CoA ligase
MIETARTWSLLSELRRGARSSRAARRDLQGWLLRRAVAHAYRHVPFYRRVWTAAGVDPDSVRDIDDLGRLPIISTDQVRAAAGSGELWAQTADTVAYQRFPTSGSSGTPLLVPRGVTEARLWRAAGLRMLFEHGFRWSYATVQFDPPSAPLHLLQRLGLARTTWIAPALPLDQQLVRFAAAGAQVVVATPTVLRRLCRGLVEHDVRPRLPLVVFCQGEILDAHSRDVIRVVLNADPVSVYGMSEVGYVAWQCEARAGLHVNAEMVAVEIVHDGIAATAGQLGQVVVSDLRGRSMPLLRCDTGDLAVAGADPCACGRTLPTLNPIEGRRRQAIRLADGSIVTPRAVVNCLAGTLGPDDYRLHQESEQRFRLRLTPEASARLGDEASLRRQLGELLGDVDIQIDVVALPPSIEKTQVVTVAGSLEVRVRQEEQQRDAQARGRDAHTIES